MDSKYINFIRKAYLIKALAGSWEIVMQGVAEVLLCKEDRDLLKDSIDMHVHCGPECVPAKVDAIDLAQQVREFGMKAAVMKSHFTETSSWAVIASKFYGRSVYGGVVLNWDVGGLNKYAVRAALGPVYEGRSLLKVVWMPTLHAKDMLESQFKEGERDDIPKLWGGEARGSLPIKEVEPIVINDSSKEKVNGILKLIAENDLVLATGHISVGETIRLVEWAESMNVDKIVITHTPIEKMTDKQLLDLTGKGAYLEFCQWISTRNRSFRRMLNVIENVGSERCILSSDLGRPNQPIPPLGLLEFIKRLIGAGMSKDDINKMVKDNPAKLLGI